MLQIILPFVNRLNKHECAVFALVTASLLSLLHSLLHSLFSLLHSLLSLLHSLLSLLHSLLSKDPVFLGFI